MPQFNLADRLAPQVVHQQGQWPRLQVAMPQLPHHVAPPGVELPVRVDSRHKCILRLLRNLNVFELYSFQKDLLRARESAKLSDSPDDHAAVGRHRRRKGPSADLSNVVHVQVAQSLRRVKLFNVCILEAAQAHFVLAVAAKPDDLALISQGQRVSVASTDLLNAFYVDQRGPLNGFILRLAALAHRVVAADEQLAVQSHKAAVQVPKVNLTKALVRVQQLG